MAYELFSKLIITHLLFWIIISLSIVSDAVDDKVTGLALSHVTLLFPFSSDVSNPVRFKISASGGRSQGCVRWYAENGAVAHLRPVFHGPAAEQCPEQTSREVVISAVSAPVDGRMTTMIFAEDPISKESAECQVFVDEVKKLHIATSTRLIYLGKYESLQVAGQDSQGNDFTTLRGLPLIFHGLGINVKQLKFEEAKLIMPETYSDMAKAPTDLIPVQGYSTGKEVVTVTLDKSREPAHHAEKGEAELFVVQQFSVDPPQLFMPLCSTAQLSLLTTTFVHSSFGQDESQHTRTRVQMPNPKYKFTLETEGVLSKVDDTGRVQSSTRTEKFKVVAEDVTYNENSKAVIVNVLNPSIISAEVMTMFDPNDFNPRPPIRQRNDEQWYLVQDVRYHIRISLWTVYRQQAHSLCMRSMEGKYHKSDAPSSFNTEYICRGLHFKVMFFDSNNLAILDDSVENRLGYLKNLDYENTNQEFEFIPKYVGEYLMLVVFTPCTSVTEGITFSKRVFVSEPIRILPTSNIVCTMSSHKRYRVLLPYIGHDRPGTLVFVTGGSGTFLGSQLNASVATVNASEETPARATVVGHLLGSTHGFVEDAMNRDNFVFFEIEVARVAEWSFGDTDRKEILIGTTLELLLRARASEGRSFSSVQGLQGSVLLDTAKRGFQPSFDFSRFSMEKMYKQIENNELSEFLNGEQDFAIIKKKFECQDLEILVLARAIMSGYDTLVAYIAHFDSPDGTPDSFFTKIHLSIYEPIEPIPSRFALANDHTFGIQWRGGPPGWPKVFNNLSDTLLPSTDLTAQNVELTARNMKAFRAKYDPKTMTIHFTCHQTSHQMLTLTVQNQRANTLPKPVKVEASLEVWCWPPLEFIPSTLTMGVGKREPVSQYHPEWLKSPNAADFYVNIGNPQTYDSPFSGNAVGILTVTTENDQSFLNSRKLGSVTIMGILQHKSADVYVHPDGFNTSLIVFVAFRGFKISIPSTFMLLGQSMVAHVEGMDGELPLKHNFDDVYVEWSVSDVSVAQLQSIVLPPGGSYLTTSSQGNGEGKGLSVKIITNIVGEFNLKAVVTLRNAPKSMIGRFDIQITIRILPNVLPRCNQIILRPNSTFHFSSLFRHQLNVNILRGVYELKISSENSNYVIVREEGLSLKPNTPTTSNFLVHVGLVSPNDPWTNPFTDPKTDSTSTGSVVKKNDRSFAAPQLAAFVVTAVQPTGFDVWDEPSKKNMELLKSSPDVGLKIGSDKKVVLGTYAAKRFSATDNLMCESDRSTIQISMLDELTRELTIMSSIFAHSNDTSILTIGPTSLVNTDSLAPGHAIFTMHAQKPGHAVVMIRDESNTLYSFISIEVLSAEDCRTWFQVNPSQSDKSACSDNDTYSSRVTPQRRSRGMQRQEFSITSSSSHTGFWTVIILVGITFALCCCRNIISSTTRHGNVSVLPSPRRDVSFNPLRLVQKDLKKFQNYSSSFR